ncbi:glycosyl hydrolase family 61 [Purpureocillium lavendulum]|uniref:lytic cellulose monooxygenase (C4-dehydrogenating) n=1 Tax=Purpureocillium lavendulum TaxID=1247861 RepID=A0AB34FRW4_9HYPO|nr:glycosyl hydrolase family 61 [Purpureocillium lavendulum]
MLTQHRALAWALVLTGGRIAAGHGHVDWVVANGVAYRGYDSPAFPYDPNHEKVIGWTVDVPDNGFVEPNSFGGPDIICHNSATSAPGHATVNAGDSIMLQWNTWPESHKGPVLDYLAKCAGDCETVDKTALEFFKISAGGLLDGSLNNGRWADDVLIANNNSWTVQIPKDLAPGNYVLRHEIIALHSAGQANGAQAYPQCFNLKVQGSGTLQPKGVKGTELYKPDSPGIVFNLYNKPSSYPIPGPTVVSGLSPTAEQSFTRATATSHATLPNGDNTGSPVTTSPSAVVPSTVVPSAVVPTTVVATTPAITPTTLVTVTTPRPSAVPTTQASPSSSPATTQPSSGVASIYGQCGGMNWNGPTTCSAGLKCQVQNPYYSQCLEDAPKVLGCKAPARKRNRA